MIAKIRWFKSSGKWYSDAEEDFRNVKHFHEGIEAFKLLIASGKRPGLVDSLNNEFDAYVEFWTEFGPLPVLFINGKNFY